ncbi:MAG: LysM peptidoglycan-binding domain-containing protein [Pseudomonadota bacterium]
MSRLRAALGATALALGLAGAGAAQPEICGEHVVAPGETLVGISREVYGRPAPDLIFEANRDRLDSPDSIRPGQTLRLPCDPRAEGQGAAPADAESDPPATPPPTLPAPLAAADEPVTLALRAPPDAPALARLRAALSRAGREVSPVPDAALHPDGPALLAAPVADPGCARLSALTPEAARLCVRHDWSAPLRRTEVVWLAAAGSELARARGPEALLGRVLCRPRGLPEGDMAAGGLTPPRITRLAPADAAACLRAVLSGEAEAAGLPAPMANAALESLGAEAEGLARLPALTGPISEHAISRRVSAKGRAALAALDRGLASLDEGED